jgi:hypothetical protein
MRQTIKRAQRTAGPPNLGGALPPVHHPTRAASANEIDVTIKGGDGTEIDIETTFKRKRVGPRALLRRDTRSEAKVEALRREGVTRRDYQIKRDDGSTQVALGFRTGLVSFDFGLTTVSSCFRI